MKYWEKKWHLALKSDKNIEKKIIKEFVEEAKGDPKAGDKLMRRDVEKNPRDDLKADPLISDWCAQFGYFPYQTLKNQWDPFLGAGAQGSVYSVTKNGKLYAVKLVSKSHGHGAENEWKVRNRFASIYTKMPDHIRKHFPKIYDMGEYDADEAVATEGNTEYYYYVMEYLEPLESRYAKYFQGEEGRADTGPFAANPDQYDIFSNQRYGDLEKAFDRLLENIYYTSPNIKNIFSRNNLTIPYGDENKEIISAITQLANELLYETWSRDFKKSQFSKLKSENDLDSYVFEKMSANYKKKSAAVKRLAAIIIKPEIDKINYGPDIIKKIRDVSINIAALELNKFMVELFDKFAKYVTQQSLPYNYYKFGKDVFGYDYDVDLLRSGPITEFRQAMIHAARNYDLNVDDIKAQNVMQRGKDLVMVDIGVWGLNTDNE